MFSGKAAKGDQLGLGLDEPIGMGFTLRFVGLLFAYGATALLVGSVFALVIALIARPAETILAVAAVIGAIGAFIFLRRALRRLDRSLFHVG